MTGVLGQALAYAERGWPVFPCKPLGKVPAIPSAHPDGDPARDTCTGECGRDGHGFHDATTDPDVIAAWWRIGPDRNVGIATGAPAFDALDVDVKPSGSGFAAFSRLRQAGLLTGACAMIRTRSGGLHLYFAGTAQPCGRLPRHYLDFKAAGGYVIAPPSFVGADDTGPAGAYELLDQRDGTGGLDWQAVRRVLDPPPPRVGLRPPRGAGGTEHLADWVAALPEGNRNNGLFWAACRAIDGGGDVELLIAASTLGEIEARRTVASAARKAGK